MMCIYAFACIFHILTQHDTNTVIWYDFYVVSAILFKISSDIYIYNI